MKKSVFVILVTSIIGCNTESEKVIKQYTIEQFYKNINIRGGSFSADESKLLISSNESGIYNAYELSLDGSAAKPLTNSTKESYFAQSYFPEDDRILYTYDQGGNENYGLYVMSSAGISKNLTPWDSTRNGFWGWSRDKQSMFISTNKRDSRFMDLHELAISSIDDETPISEVIYQYMDLPIHHKETL